ncbi:MAG: Mth938-like domain-containing protein [Pseudomonadota bacterium]
MDPAGRKFIEGYGGGGFRVGGERLEGSILLRPDRVLAWARTDLGLLSKSDLAPLFEGTGAVEILLIGCGRRAVLMPPALRQDIRALGTVVDAMDTGAACRTYNVLVAEQRLVAAALIAVE